MESTCRYFTGYKPCGKSQVCDSNCASRDIPNQRILVVHLGALGAVLRGTCILPALKRKYPSSHLTWVTDAPAQNFFLNNNMVDRVLTTSENDLLSLSALKFDLAFCIDKSLKAGGVLARTKFEKLFGFKIESSTGTILPATAAANELWQIGLNDHFKFQINRKTENQLMCEALELDWQKQEYQVFLSESEREESLRRRAAWSHYGEKIIIGINTGCAPVIPYKKLTALKHRQLIKDILKSFPRVQILLLGGPEDTQLNQEIGRDLDVIQSPTQAGVRDGLVSMNAVDLLLSGDSLGMHMAIGLKKWVIAWFGPTCAHEIELYDRGVHLLAPVNCSPCWKRNCDKPQLCRDVIENIQFIEAVKNYLQLHPLQNDALTEANGFL